LPNCTRGAKSSLGISAALADAFRPLNHYAQNVRSGRFGKSAYRSIVVLTIFHDFASWLAFLTRVKNSLKNAQIA